VHLDGMAFDAVRRIEQLTARGIGRLRGGGKPARQDQQENKG
jgi:hypothetical protein